ncbi:relaxase/mobilization nuclease domain-containing protein [Ornithobacterium rhinotracheale]|uniref:relaxase/mobilization nuclease domain-containing protein n=1 Tax=Ornithobacterium rhinotracheale TaxID=28251 RepID=UPI001FF21A52|nr:relaxase/mobilization nuclease domain-containing protein [Ornithobacterium rhinotracheale]MCK0205588.1 relaxase/mobilization nuclease domain-containing protein [Ornithobacterium rhinotracheale]
MGIDGLYFTRKNIGDSLTNEELADITIQSLRKIGVTELNQYRLDIHNSTKQKHIHFVVNRVDLNGKCTVKAHDIGKRFGEAVRSVCKEKGIKTDIEITAEKRKKCLTIYSWF